MPDSSPPPPTLVHRLPFPRTQSPFRPATEILSPRPRRHLLESSASQHWLRSSSSSPPPFSPGGSSRATSPVSTISPTYQRPTFSSLHSLSSPDYTRLRALSLAHAQAHPHARAPPSAGRRFIRYMHKRGLRTYILPVTFLFAFFIKYCVGLGGYSGMGTPPMFGDYEAQRHWMEITLHLPVRQWYTYDLQYWGLDYPPLTAYVSWICGYIGAKIDPTWFALDASRGIETPDSKLYMRSTVLALDSIVYVPALYLFARTWQGTRSHRTQEMAILTLLLQPALLLIDFGHFQYNSVMLGLTLLAISLFAANHDVLGAVCFTLSLGFKQMALYYAPAIGSYLLAKCVYLGPIHGTRLFLKLGLATVLTLIVLFLPYLPGPRTLAPPLTRIFPLARGLFEDKVANFWCLTNIVIKWRVRFTQPALVRMAAAGTALGFLPAAALMGRAGWVLRLPPAVATPSTNGTAATAATTKVPAPNAHPPFLPLLPYALLTSSLASSYLHSNAATPGADTWEWGVLLCNVGAASMWPLLKKDGLGLQYAVLLVLWNRVFVALVSHGLLLLLHVAELTLAPPARLPDLWAVLNVVVCAPVFALGWTWSVKCGVETAWAVGGLGWRGKGSEKGKAGKVKDGKKE
ncbi:ALG6, ALG8 glycosyltransferase family-domain-containing protein [Infundibulicybe gibba]|nr:ALG6, ALG8 glycosyltransferase family-domain-containing protein [Infundibulicybe gibba]